MSKAKLLANIIPTPNPPLGADKAPRKPLASPFDDFKRGFQVSGKLPRGDLDIAEEVDFGENPEDGELFSVL